jgi:WD40 repeat protein
VFRPFSVILRISIALLAYSALQGCIVVPNLKRIKGPDDVAPITIGESIRDDVIDILGQPNVASGDDLLVYNWEKSRYFWAVGAMYSAAIGSGGHKGYRAVVELDPDGRVVRVLSESSAGAPKQQVENWDRIRGCGLLELPRAIAVSPDATQTVALVKNELCFAPAVEGGEARRFHIGKSRRPWGNFGASMIFSPDGNRLALAAPGRSLALWDVASGQEICLFGEEDNVRENWFFPPRPVTFSPDGRRLAAPDIDGEFAVWDVETGAELLRHSPSALLGTVAFSHTGNLLGLGLLGGGLEILDADTGQVLFQRNGIPESPDMAAAAFSPDGNWLAVGTPVHIELWDLPALRDSGWATGRRAVFILPFYRHTPASNMYVRPVVGFSSDGNTLAVFMHETITVFDMESLAMSQIYRFRFPVLAVAFDPEWRRLALLSVNGLRVWDIPTDEQD